jgi:hypothetical protein
METWRVESLIKSLEECAGENRRDAENFKFDQKMSGYSEGRADAQQQAAKWLRDALATAAKWRSAKVA